MAQRVLAAQVTVTAGTAVSAPHAVDVSFSAGTVTSIEIIIPDGHAGFTGIALQQAHQQIIPEKSGTWIIGNNDNPIFPVSDYLNNGSWQALMYNTDVYDHSFYLRFLVDNINASAATTAFATGTPIVVGDAAPAPEANPGVALDFSLPQRPVEV